VLYVRFPTRRSSSSPTRKTKTKLHLTSSPCPPTGRKNWIDTGARRRLHFMRNYVPVPGETVTPLPPSTTATGDAARQGVRHEP